MNKPCSFYLVSSPLHLLVSIAVANANKPFEDAYLYFVSQEADNQRMTFFRQSMSQTKNSPFKNVSAFFKPASKSLKGKKERVSNFKQLKKDVESFRPEKILVGNDRHMEFQWVMYCAKSLGMNTKGIYLDEGLYTYTGRKSSKNFSERLVDQLLKKIVYGSWWQTPKTIGASSWVHEVMVAYPDLVHQDLKNKSVNLLEPRWFSDKGLQLITDEWLAHFSITKESLLNSNVFITLPEKRDMSQVTGYLEQCNKLVRSLVSLGLKVAVKYHPKDYDSDLVGVGSLHGVVIIPANIPFEVILPNLNHDSIVMGDMSTTILTTHLFRRDIKVMVMKLGAAASQFAELELLYSKLGLEARTIEQILSDVETIKV